MKRGYEYKSTWMGAIPSLKEIEVDNNPSSRFFGEKRYALKYLDPEQKQT